jgi:phosphatidylserine/phosphatidylglycerophosphate/cardiolipin synthase-like enzyme
MAARVPPRPHPLPLDRTLLRTLANQAFSRTAGAPLVAGNTVRILRDAAENYPAWEQAIADARTCIHVEMYIFHRDRLGRRFVDLLAAKARAGVAVRVVYDWFGCGLGPWLGLFKPLEAAGGEVRVFNRMSVGSALGWVRRDHRKLITVDGSVAFVGGLCIGLAWAGDPAHGQDPWRDTGVAITGPAVRHADEAFAESWRLCGGRYEDCLLPSYATTPAGPVNLRLIATEPFTANLLRLDLLIASLARKTLWLTDAYFIGTGPYLEALRRAALDGVDVRLLLPQGSDVGWTVPVSRSLYRPLLEDGVRIFEWNGTMIHAKTALADGRWARIGSTNLNLNSWIGNWELDVAIEDDTVAGTLAGHFQEDLSNATEIVLATYRTRARPRRPSGASYGRYRASRRLVHTVTGVSRSLGAAVTGNRRLEDFEVAPVIAAAILLTVTAGVGLLAPRALAWPLAGLAGWTAITFLVEAWALWRAARRRRHADAAPAKARQIPP